MMLPRACVFLTEERFWCYALCGNMVILKNDEGQS